MDAADGFTALGLCLQRSSRRRLAAEVHRGERADNPIERPTAFAARVLLSFSRGGTAERNIRRSSHGAANLELTLSVQELASPRLSHGLLLPLLEGSCIKRKAPSHGHPNISRRAQTL